MIETDCPTKKPDHIDIYVCGACDNNTGLGGWGAVLVFGKHVKEIFGKEDSTTNNRMELIATINALKSLLRPCDVMIYSSSQYLTKGIETLPEWQETKRLDQENQFVVKNANLWNDLNLLILNHHVKCSWIKRDNGDHWCERSSYLSKKGMYLQDVNTKMIKNKN